MNKKEHAHNKTRLSEHRKSRLFCTETRLYMTSTHISYNNRIRIKNVTSAARITRGVVNPFETMKELLETNAPEIIIVDELGITE